MTLNLIDLHTHTTASDGSLSPEQLVTQASALGLYVLSITDHDTTDSFEPALAAAVQCGLQLIPGIEITSDDDGHSVHFLGYYIEPSSPILQAELGRQRVERICRARAIVERLSSDGYALSWEQVEANSTGAVISRPQIAQALIESGYASSVDDAFARLIGPSAPYFIPRPHKLDPAATIRLIQAADGVAVLAHPVDGKSSNLVSNSLLCRLASYVDAGLRGLEVYYTGYTHVTTQALIHIARQYGIFVTGGSDFHGTAKPDYELGGVYVPTQIIEDLATAHNTNSTATRRSP